MATKGLKEVEATFQRLEKAGQVRALRSAMNAALNPALKTLRAQAPKGSEAHKTYKGRVVAPGFLSRSVVKSVRVARDKSAVFGKVKLRGEAFYGSMIEHGWTPGSRKGRSQNVSKIAPRPWFHPTVDKLSDATLQAFSDKMEQAVIREWNK